ncbi:GTP cyclohydrolase-2 [Jannaschia pagri]|uniref:GTP cyclohydrolase-2 n=1 Tax=Jannaschia pagri TaxID=2829797 RepID=A0ABQ4NQC4_9RHOB|nr:MULTISPECIES: GTP cyclohydrolase II [unclassified Jannaschia]GIT92660.1 GTP cyclohydrolase-2 [Jannaschia sp. AI_61]GIT96480.1 GTP cyclohydrolase-2 [Jannaschia sp. AI_62]
MLAPTLIELAARARADLRLGVPICVGGVTLAAAETLSAERLEALGRLGPLTIALTDRRAQTLKARVYDGDISRISVPQGADLAWLRALADPADDLRKPMKGPLLAQRDGDAVPWRTAIALAKAAQVLPAVVGVEVLCPDGLTQLPAHLPPGAAGLPRDVAAARLPMAAARAGRLHVFREDAGGEEHYAVEIGAPDRAAPVLVRLHSACFTGDVLGSLKCDCGPQLHAALDAMGQGGSGILLYLNQEGRGIGLANKMRAYDLQDQGFDTVQANHRLGFEDDERDFRLGASLLKRLGISRIRLMTNNPRKIDMMQAQGIEVAERVPLNVGRGPDNAAYLDVKRDKSGHLR